MEDGKCYCTTKRQVLHLYSFGHQHHFRSGISYTTAKEVFSILIAIDRDSHHRVIAEIINVDKKIPIKPEDIKSKTV